MLIEQPNRKYWTYTSLKWLVWFNIFTTILHYVDNMTPAVNNGEKHLVDYIRQPDGKSLGIPGQVI